MTTVAKRSLTAYRRKRDFGHTAEPEGDSSTSAGQRYVMHKHAASHLHYDLRLEDRGVLRSWALPKGPSLVRGEKRLAVEVEDHLIEYGAFEGIIPKGQYGGGTVMLWDAGSWVVTGKHDADRIDFRLDGSKLKGAWTLVRTGSKSGRPENNWLLIKRGRNDISKAQAHDRSIHSGRSMKEIASGVAFDRSTIATQGTAPVSPADIPGARRRALPASFAPQLATEKDLAPDGDDWVHEIKFDGYRMIVHISKGKVRLLSRNGHNWTPRFPMQAQQLEALAVNDAILDGEMVAMAPDGTPSFGALQDLISSKNTGSLVLQLFDLTYLDGYDLTAATTSPPDKPTAAPRAPARARGDDVVEGIRITHPERIVYPDVGLTKIEIARFYADIQDWLLPLLANRLLSLVRCPDGSQQKCFFQKHLAASQARNVPRQDFRQSKGAKPYAYVQSIAHVIALVQSGVLEFHPFGSLITDPEHPDLMVFDLDPSPGVQWQDILKVTRELRERLEKLGFTAFLRTTGGKGVHVVVPLRPTTDWDGVAAFAKALSEQTAADAPSRLTTKLPKAQRHNKIFIDYLRNGRGATAVASYSTRARPGAPVAVPIRWNELTSSLRPDRYTVANLRRRLAALKQDPWEDFYDAGVAITSHRRKAVGL